MNFRKRFCSIWTLGTSLNGLNLSKENWTHRDDDVTVEAAIEIFELTLHPHQAVLLAVIQPMAGSAGTNDSLLKTKYRELSRTFYS